MASAFGSLPGKGDLNAHILPPTVASVAVNKRRRGFWRWFPALLVLPLYLVCTSTLDDSFRLGSLFGLSEPATSYPMALVYDANISDASRVCSGYGGHGGSYSGYIRVKSDTEVPKKLFFWFFQAEKDPDNAPIILTIGGGPGTSGLMNPIFGQSPCIITPNGLSPNPNRWTQHFNLLALDHPIGAGYSYGSPVNNSRTAALDAYDFLQGFFDVFPQLAGNQFVVSGGSYGGIYVPNIATVIQEQNQAIATRSLGAMRFKTARHINLESLMISNPMSNPTSHWTWLLYYRCTVHQLYNATTCAEQYAQLPACLQDLEHMREDPSPSNREALFTTCINLRSFPEGYDDIVMEDIRRRCKATGDDPLACHPEFEWIDKFFNNVTTKALLGVPQDIHFTPVDFDVNFQFMAYGDIWLAHYLQYETLFKQGIRILHWIGSMDANCAWPGILSFLELLQTPYQKAFLSTPDVPWPSEENKKATARVVGEGAGNMTYILLDEAGHFVVKDQPVVAKSIVEHWVLNEPWFN